MIYNEKIGNQWYHTTIEVNGSMKDIPLLGRLFGTKQVTCDQEWDKENIVELHSIIYKGKIYIYKEIIITRIKINGPKNNSYNREFDRRIFNTVVLPIEQITITTNPEPKKDHWIYKYFNKKKRGSKNENN